MFPDFKGAAVGLFTTGGPIVTV